MHSSPNQTAIVTGASSGIGKAAAKLLSQNGYRVFGFSRSVGQAASGVTEIKVDITDTAAVAQAVKQVISDTGRIDVLVNAAAYSIMGALEESSMTQARALFDTNLFGTIEVCHAVLPFMRAQKSGRIINLSSLLGVMPAPFMGYYAASKHALEGYTSSLDHEVRTLGIRALIIQAGPTKTNIMQHLQQADSLIADYRSAAGRVESVIGASVDKGDTPETIAKTILSAATAPKPHSCYTAGKNIALFSLLWRLLPRALFDKELRKEYKLDA